jgi:ferric-dicitrate binding protein FerR (iron transport regulator)
VDERIARAAARAPRPDEGDVLAPGLVHEVRQPLTALDAALRLVARELGPEVTGLDGWKIATAQLARAQETLATYQQLMTGGAARDTFAPASVARAAVQGLRERLDPLGGRFALVVEDDRVLAHGSALALHHAVSNLLANALDAITEAGDHARVEVRVLRGPGPEGRPQVRVADAGVGIPPSVRARLFTPRFTTKPVGTGSGLGLAVSRRMLRAAGAEVRLAADDDPLRRPWAATELVVELPTPAGAPVAPERPPRRARGRAGLRVAALAALLIVIVAAGWAGFHRWVRSGDAPPSAPAAARPDRVEIVELQGAIERLAPGGWLPVARGGVLREDDTLRTAAGSSATLAIGGGSRVTVSDATQLTVREITAAVQRLRLSRGRISVDHQADGARVLVVESDRGDAVARANAARFSVLANGAALAVATETGIVRLQAAGRAVDVAAGQQSVSYRGEAPTAPSRIPVDLVLRVARAARVEAGSCTVEGVVERGSEVRVDGRPVEPGADGRFSVRVAAPRGATHVAVATRDASGRVAERRVACRQEVSEHDLSDFAVRWGQHAPASR